MNAAVEILNAWSQAWTASVIAILLQSTALALLVGLIAYALRQSSAQLRFWLWQIVAIKLLMMPFWTWTIPVTLSSHHVPATTVADAPPIELPLESDESAFPANKSGSTASDHAPENPTPVPEYSPSFTWQSWLLVAWFVVVFLQILRLAWQRVRLGRVIHRAIPADEPLVQLVADSAEHLGVKCRVRAALTDLDCSPFVCRIWKPILVLPRGVINTLHETQLRQVLLHELAHVKRCDLLWSWLPEITRVFYFFHPIVYYVDYRIRLERELACDQLALSASGASAADYADTLVKVVGHSSQPGALKAVSAVGMDGDEP